MVRELRSKNEQLKESMEKLRYMATRDPLTGLANRRFFNEQLTQQFNEAVRYSTDLSCCMIDLDNYKQFNDTLGHQLGDELLQIMAEEILSSLRGADIAGRVEAVGKDVKQFHPSDGVFGCIADAGFGGFAEYVAVPEESLAHKPRNLTFEQAAAVPLSGVLALQGLRDTGQVQAGQRVLVVGASSGNGTFIVQIAKALGAEVTGVCSTRNLAMGPLDRRGPRDRLHARGLLLHGRHMGSDSREFGISTTAGLCACARS